MTNKISQDWDRLKTAIAQIRQDLREAELVQLHLGAVGKTEEGLIGVVTGVDSPPCPQDEWTYSIYIPDTDYVNDSEESWYDRSQLELVQWEDD